MTKTAGCVIKAARETAALMFGVPVSEMLGKNLSDFLPRACPSRNAEDMLIVGDATANAGTKRGGLGGKKKVVGKLMPLVSTNASHDFLWQASKHYRTCSMPSVLVLKIECVAPMSMYHVCIYGGPNKHFCSNKASHRLSLGTNILNMSQL